LTEPFEELEDNDEFVVDRVTTETSLVTVGNEFEDVITIDLVDECFGIRSSQQCIEGKAVGEIRPGTAVGLDKFEIFLERARRLGPCLRDYDGHNRRLHDSGFGRLDLDGFVARALQRLIKAACSLAPAATNFIPLQVVTSLRMIFIAAGDPDVVANDLAVLLDHRANGHLPSTLIRLITLTRSAYCLVLPIFEPPRNGRRDLDMDRKLGQKTADWQGEMDSITDSKELK
jgi:hypothetical protein